MNDPTLGMLMLNLISHTCILQAEHEGSLYVYYALCASIYEIVHRWVMATMIAWWIGALPFGRTAATGIGRFEFGSRGSGRRAASSS